MLGLSMTLETDADGSQMNARGWTTAKRHFHE